MCDFMFLIFWYALLLMLLFACKMIQMDFLKYRWPDSVALFAEKTSSHRGKDNQIWLQDNRCNIAFIWLNLYIICYICVGNIVMINYSFCNKLNLSCTFDFFPHCLPTNPYPTRIFSISQASEQLLRAAGCLLACLMFVCFSLENVTVKHFPFFSQNMGKISSFTLAWSTERTIYCPHSLLTELVWYLMFDLTAIEWRGG